MFARSKYHIPFYLYHNRIGLDELPDNRTHGIMLFGVIMLGFFYVPHCHKKTRYQENFCIILFGYAFDFWREDFYKPAGYYEQLMSEADNE